jgi:hypothetical protein
MLLLVVLSDEAQLWVGCTSSRVARCAAVRSPASRVANQRARHTARTHLSPSFTSAPTSELLLLMTLAPVPEPLKLDCELASEPLAELIAPQLRPMPHVADCAAPRRAVLPQAGQQQLPVGLPEPLVHAEHYPSRRFRCRKKKHIWCAVGGSAIKDGCNIPCEACAAGVMLESVCDRDLVCPEHVLGPCERFHSLCAPTHGCCWPRQHSSLLNATAGLSVPLQIRSS